MGARAHLLIACLQVSLWLYRGFILEEPALFSTLMLGMVLWYHSLDVMFGGAARLRRSAQFWKACWWMVMLGCVTVPILYDVEGWPWPVVLRSFLFALPCLLLTRVPVIESDALKAVAGLPAQNW